MADEVDEIRSRIDIVNLVGRSVALKRAGKDWKGLCPFHDDRNPSFTVSANTGRYRCWSCGESGDAFTWVMKTQNMDFKEALQVLAQETGVTLKKQSPKDRSERLTRQAAMDAALEFFRKELERSPEAREYCERRGLTKEIQDRWELGYAPDVAEALPGYLQKRGFSLAECKDLFLVDQDVSGGYYSKFRARLMFPIRTERGDLVAFGGRILGQGEPKYINSSDTPLYRKSRVLYALNVAKDHLREGAPAVLCEGYLDVIACHTAGVKTAIASLGTSLSEEHAKLLHRWTDGVTILYDSDAAGEKAAERATHILQAEGMKVTVALMPQGQDPDTLLREAGAGAVQKSVEEGLSPLEYAIRSIQNKHDPKDSDYWTLMVEALAREPSEFARVANIHELATRYPDLRDPVEARKVLSKLVQARRKETPHPKRIASRSVVTKQPQLHSSEASVFLGFLSEDLRIEAWRAIREPDLFFTGLGRELSEALAASFVEEAPRGIPAHWLHCLPERLQDVLSTIRPTEGRVVTEASLRDAIQMLRVRKEERDNRNLASELSDEKLPELLERMKRLSKLKDSSQ